MLSPRLVSYTSVVTVAVLVALMGMAATARADSASLAVLDAAGRDDPAVDLGRTFRLSGNVTVPKRVYVKWRPTGGAPCAPSFSTDSGEGGSLFNAMFSGQDVNGNFVLTTSRVWTRSGSFLFCIWLADSASTSVTPIAQIITFRRPTGTISGTVAPVSPLVNQNATLTVTGSSEAPKRVYASLRAGGGAACPPSFDQDSGARLLRGEDVNGSFTLTAPIRVSTAGPQQVCLWLAASSDDPSPVAGPQPVTFTALVPPPPCIVPRVSAGTPAAVAIRALGRASCSLGERKLVASRRYPRGSLIRFVPGPRTRLPNAAPVQLVLSDGRPCVVPSLRRGTSVRTAMRRLQASGCTPGRVIRRTSTRVRRGDVIGFAPSSDSRRAPRARVTIIVSRGRS